MRFSHKFTASSARFDNDNLVSDAGLVPLLGLAEQTRLPQILAGKVSITTPRITSGAANPAPADPRREGVDHDIADQVRRSQSRSQVVGRDRRDVRRRGQHR